jgi:hypothetical protein
MAKLDPEFEIESTVDLDNVDEKAAKELLNRASSSDEIEVVESPVESKTKGFNNDGGARKGDAASDNSLPVADDPTEEELAQYSESVRKRIDKLTRMRREEEREKEAAIRERNEAANLARMALERYKQLEDQTKRLAESAATASVEKLDADIAAAKKAYIEAANSYDTEAMADAQAEMADLVARKRNMQSRLADAQPVARQPEPVLQQRQPAPPAPDSRAQEWAAENQSWFQKDKAMTAFVFGVHEDLISQGIDPKSDASRYYKEIDKQMRFRFPEKFEDAQRNTPRQSSPVAPASRTVNGRRKVTLTASELSLARRLNVTPEQFALEKLKLENRNG